MTVTLTEGQMMTLLYALAATTKSGGGGAHHSLLLYLCKQAGVDYEDLDSSMILDFQQTAADELMGLGRPIR